MASTITAATLTVKLTEQIKLNGVEQGSSNTLTISGINEISKRIVTVPTAEKEIIAMSSAISSGTFITGDVRYIRITNLDDTYHIGLIFKNINSDEFSVLLDKGQSYIYNADLAVGVADTMDSADAAGVVPLAFEDLVNITATADTASCDIEVFVASV
jgi:hypothetical protein